MMPIVILMIIISFFVHSYYYDVATSDKRKPDVLLRLFRRVFSITYLFPLTIDASDPKTIVKYKKISNYALYGFYALF
jgi:hypothetical protein